MLGCLHALMPSHGEQVWSQLLSLQRRLIAFPLDRGGAIRELLLDPEFLLSLDAIIDMRGEGLPLDEAA